MMDAIKISDIVKATNGKLLSGDPRLEILPSKISTDSRTIGRGELFIAIKGPSFDGNDFAADVLEKGAVGAIVSRPPEKIGKKAAAGKIMILVKDTTKALRDIAKYHRDRFEIPVICITGSNGKTTVKDMIAHLLSSGYDVLKSDGTKNNHIGVPQTLLKLNSRHDICALELGTNHRGEIRLLSGIASPTDAVITNIGPCHLEFLKNPRGVFEEKIDILKNTRGKKAGIFINGDDKFLSKIDSKKYKVVKFGFAKGNDISAEAVRAPGKNPPFVVNGRMVFELNMLGRHNIYNALAAIAVALNFGIGYKDIREALLSFKPARMRLELQRVRGVNFINDSYNSNPRSVMEALEVVRSYPADRRWIVSADMLELGRNGARFHRLIGESIARSGADGLLTFGELSRQTMEQARLSGMRSDRLWHCSTHNEIAELLSKLVKPGDLVLLKGSRGMKVEEVLKSFR